MVLSLVADMWFDLRHGTDTYRWVHLRELEIASENKSRAEWYVPTRARAFRRIMQALDLPDRSVFIDVGAGKGRLLSSSALRFDLKQNLSTWPVLSNRLERSPPLLLAR